MSQQKPLNDKDRIDLDADTPLAVDPTLDHEATKPEPAKASEAYKSAQAKHPEAAAAMADAMADMADDMADSDAEEDDYDDNVEPIFDPVEEIAALNAQIDDLRDRLLRSAAETENVRRRAERDKIDGAKYAVVKFAEDMLNVADNFARSLEAVPEDAIADVDTSIKNLIGGIKAVDKELQSALSRHGISQIPIAENEIFDPNKHEVMFEAEDPSKPRGTIMQVLQPGYMVHDRLLRPARVGVTKGGADGPIDRTA